MRNILLFTLVVFALSFLSSCVPEEFDITGTWSLEKAEIYIDGILVETFQDTGEELTFYEDGTGRSGDFVFQWEMKDDYLIMFEFGQSVRYIIKEKQKDKIILEDREFEQDLGEIEILTLRR